MPVTLENRLRQMQVFNLVHDAYCRDGACACREVEAVVVEENPRTGDRAPRRVTRRAPAALTLLAREVRPSLPDAVLDVPDVRAAVARGQLRVVRQGPGPAPASSASPGTATEPSLDAAFASLTKELDVSPDEASAAGSRAGSRTGRKG
jgi:hypothetical protein